MSLVASAVEPSSRAESRRWPAGTKAPWLILGCYLLAAVALTWRLWISPATRTPAGNPADITLFAWIMRYSATAIAHGHLPALVTTTLNAPHGVSLLWNGAPLLPDVLLAPVTLLAGPQVSLNVMLTLGFAGSAASLFLVLRRWGASIRAAAVGGAVYGFSPALLGAATGHYHVQFAVLLPLIIDALLRIITGRGNAIRTGLWLGLLASAQLFTGEEMLTDTALATLVIVAALAASRPRAVLRRARGAAAGLATAAGVTLLICGYALWVQFRGPLTEQGSPWHVGKYANRLANFITPQGGLFFHTQASVQAVASQPLKQPEYLAYLGWPLLAIFLVAAICYWPDLRIRAAAVTWAVLEFLSLGDHPFMLSGIIYPPALLPWHLMRFLPIFSQVLPSRLPVLADGALGALLAFALDRVRLAMPQDWGWRRTGIPFAVAALAILPILPLPIRSAPLPAVPAGWQAAFSRLRLGTDARVLVVPLPYQSVPEVMRWQADTGEPASLIGGWFIGPNRAGRARPYGTGMALRLAGPLDGLWVSPASAIAPYPALLRDYLFSWQPAAVVAVTGPGTRLGRYLAGILGPPTFRVADILAWRL